MFDNRKKKREEGHEKVKISQVMLFKQEKI